MNSHPINILSKSPHGFENFVVSSNNRFAYGAAQSAAGTSLSNVYVFHSPPGLGKTHLLHAIAKSVEGSVYLTGQQFSDVVAAQAWSAGGARMLIVDDLQLLSRKAQDFLHGVLTMLETNGGIFVGACDVAPYFLRFPKRLASRLEAGLVVGITAPAYEARMAILRAWNQESRLSEESLEFLASRIKSSVRRLEGGFVRLAFNVGATSPDDLLRDLLLRERDATITCETAMEVVCQHYGLPLSDMVSRRRPARIAHPRQIAMFLARTYSGLSLVEIGDRFGGRDHGTVIHACRTVRARMETDPQIEATVRSLECQLSAMYQAS